MDGNPDDDEVPKLWDSVENYDMVHPLFYAAMKLVKEKIHRW
jgi:hypothetical protein